jgi:hypothetical protein
VGVNEVDGKYHTEDQISKKLYVDDIIAIL